MNPGQLFNVLQPMFAVQDLPSQSLEAQQVFSESSTFSNSEYTEPTNLYMLKVALCSLHQQSNIFFLIVKKNHLNNFNLNNKKNSFEPA